MKNKLTVDYHEGLIEHLTDPKAAAAYLDAALEEGNEKLFLKALRNVAEAQGGVRQIAGKTKLNRENLYRMLSPTGNPQLDTLEKILNAFGFRLSVRLKSKRLSLAKA